MIVVDEEKKEVVVGDVQNSTQISDVLHVSHDVDTLSITNGD